MKEVSTKYCRYCGRLLRSKESIARGFGLTCYKKYIQSMQGGGLFAKFRDNKGQEHNS